MKKGNRGAFHATSTRVEREDDTKVKSRLQQAEIYIRDKRNTANVLGSAHLSRVGNSNSNTWRTSTSCRRIGLTSQDCRNHRRCKLGGLAGGSELAFCLAKTTHGHVTRRSTSVMMAIDTYNLGGSRCSLASPVQWQRSTPY